MITFPRFMEDYESIFSELNIYQIRLKNNFDELDKLNIWLLKVSDWLDFSSRTLFRVDLVLAEIVTNILENAYSDNQIDSIIIQIQGKKNKIFLTVEDNGQEFNPFAQPEFQASETVEDAKIGGLGIHLIRNFSDEYSYQRQEKTNRITVVFTNEQDVRDDQ
jgi:anti-sigma regulatory factor (Ser/Thr protein kinase)